PDPAEHRRHDPVERRDEQVLPLEPDAGGAVGVDGAGERDRHFRVRAGAEALRDHQPRAEAPAAEEVLAAAAHPIAGDEADRRDDDEISDEHRPVERGDVHGHSITCRTWSAPRSGSQSACTRPAVTMPRQAAGTVDAIGTTSSIDRPVNRTIFAIARSSVSADPARYGVPGSETRPSADSSDLTPPVV